jgi:hypothetical protein
MVGDEQIIPSGTAIPGRAIKLNDSAAGTGNEYGVDWSSDNRFIVTAGGVRITQVGSGTGYYSDLVIMQLPQTRCT